MKSVTLFFLVGFVGLIGFTQAVDYCSPTFCQKGEKHIGCKNTGDFGKECPKKRKMIDVNAEIKKLILELHNSLRNDLAGGKVNGYKSASRMAVCEWDNELADLAALNVKTCVFDHDECHDTTKYKFSGQNLGIVSYSGQKITDIENIKEMITDWWKEKKDANMDIIRKYPKDWDDENKPIGHFTAMALEGNVALGCAASWFFDDDDFDNVLLACNYAKTNMENKPVYTEGAPASACKSGKDSVFKNLCSSKEQY